MSRNWSGFILPAAQTENFETLHQKVHIWNDFEIRECCQLAATVPYFRGSETAAFWLCNHTGSVSSKSALHRTTSTLPSVLGPRSLIQIHFSPMHNQVPGHALPHLHLFLLF